MFLSAEPNHWCASPELDTSFPNMSLEEKKMLTLPRVDGKEFSKCEMWDVDKNWTQLYEENRNSWPLRPITNKTMECKHGWNYDRSEYKDSFVTEVRKSVFSLKSFLKDWQML